MKIRQLEKRGFPELAGGLFVTLTVDYNKRCWCEDVAYEKGLDRIRRMISRLRQKYNIRRWFWKMELHKPDSVGRQYAHWHLWFDYGGYIPGEILTKAWGLGRTDIRKVRSKDWRYLFKYICKTASELPEWLASRTKVRLFQTSMHFFAGDDAEPSPRQVDTDEKENNGSQEMETIGERVLKWTRCVVARTISAGTVTHRLMVLEFRWGEMLSKFACLRMQPGFDREQITITERKVITWLPQNPIFLSAVT